MMLRQGSCRNAGGQECDRRERVPIVLIHLDCDVSEDLVQPGALLLQLSHLSEHRFPLTLQGNLGCVREELEVNCGWANQIVNITGFLYLIQALSESLAVNGEEVVAQRREEFLLTHSRETVADLSLSCLLYTSPSPRDS
eukprot:TRINITY_DN1788_c0_g1_i16.p1 TRINITY_DN1788_c0_g1~~TRINITY_DN1788_c0_g1_i16.p1  ORF type:complete len:140 (+),score=22.74 TRINITY_DN1788_c0_g1_i16:312-731(+)